jgi:hypothetical protein
MKMKTLHGTGICPECGCKANHLPGASKACRDVAAMVVKYWETHKHEILAMAPKVPWPSSN